MADIGKEDAKDVVEQILKKEFDSNDFDIDYLNFEASNHNFIVNKSFVFKIDKNFDWSENTSNEAKILQRLENFEDINVPKLVDHGVFQDLDYLVLEFVDGETLDQYSEGCNFYKLGKSEKKNAAYRMGKTLATVHNSNDLDKFGLLNSETQLEAETENWNEGLKQLQKWWHQKLNEKGYGDETSKAEKVLANYESRLNKLDSSCLLHMEFDLRNLIFQDEEIFVLDWEVSASGDPELDRIMTEKRLIWRQKEDKEILKAFREGYSTVREIKVSDDVAELYEMVQMIRFLLIHEDDDKLRPRIEERLNELFESLL